MKELTRYWFCCFCSFIVYSLPTNAGDLKEQFQLQQAIRQFDRTGDFEHAEAAYRKLLIVCGDFDREHIVIEFAGFLLRNKKPDQAKKMMNDEFDIMTRKFGPTGYEVVRGHYAYAGMLKRAGLDSDAANEEKLAQKLYAQDTEQMKRQLLIGQQREKGLQAISSNNSQQSLKDLRQALNLAEKEGEWNSELPACLVDLGRAELEFGDKIKAADLLKRALALLSKHDSAYGRYYTISSNHSGMTGGEYTLSSYELRPVVVTTLKKVGKADEANKLEPPPDSGQKRGGLSLSGFKLVGRDGKPIAGTITSASGMFNGQLGKDGTYTPTPPPPKSIKTFAEEELKRLKNWRDQVSRDPRQ